MRAKGLNCLVCNCEGTMPLNEKSLSKALGSDIDHIHTHLCRSELNQYEKALEAGEPFIVACTQEAPLFHEIAEETGRQDQVSFINIRETAGWSHDAKNANAKIAALLNSAQYEAEPARLKSIQSDGMCLVYGRGQEALETAKLLSSKLSVTLLLSSDDEFLLPSVADIPIYRGDIAGAEGSLGAFKVTVNNYAPLIPSAKDALSFIMARDGAQSECSLIFDMSGNTPLFAGHTHRDGYARVDPANPSTMLKAVIEFLDLVGEFEKPIYVDYNADICAHSRSKKQGCNKCLDVCPAGAISDQGDIIAIDPGICGGCGSCHSVCPTGAISYQYPQRADIIGRAQLLIQNFLAAGGKNPTLLLHDETFGNEQISAMARYGRGLPANMLPVAIHSTTTIGHVEMAALIASGAAGLAVLADPQKSDELSGSEAEMALCQAILNGLGYQDARLRLIVENDPDIIESVLWESSQSVSHGAANFSVAGSKREIARMAFTKLHQAAPIQPDIINLPEASPYGVVEIDQVACTLCMACTSACPASAITDTPGEPKLRFVENSCVQCGLCVSTCPENALSLKPQLNFTPQVMQPITLYEEEPFCCIVCDTPFATQSTIERISSQLAGKHSMFVDSERANLLKMCEDCRIEAQANSANDPFAAVGRPKVRTTEDYIQADQKGLSVDDFLMDD